MEPTGLHEAVAGKLATKISVESERQQMKAASDRADWLAKVGVIHAYISITLSSLPI